MYLYGASGHAKVIIELLEANGVDIKALIDDDLAINALWDYPVLHILPQIDELIVSIGHNGIRRKIAESLSVSFGKAIHPSAVISPRSRIDAGSVVMQGSIVQADARVGKHCIVNSGASIDHECVLEDYVHLSPHVTLCGNVSIGEGAWIGAGSVVLPGVTVGKWSVIGAGSVVSKSIPEDVLAVGNRC